jgi:hypothetical protein
VGRVIPGARRNPRSHSDSVFSNDPRPGGQETLWRRGGVSAKWYQSEYIIDFCKGRSKTDIKGEGYQKRQHNAA